MRKVMRKLMIRQCEYRGYHDFWAEVDPEAVEVYPADAKVGQKRYPKIYKVCSRGCGAEKLSVRLPIYQAPKYSSWE